MNTENIVSDVKSGKTYSLRKVRGVKSTSNEPVSTRVLRSHKRNLVQPESNDKSLPPKKPKISDLLNKSDCIILNDSESINPLTNVNKLITSTPVVQNRVKTPDFGQTSCIKTGINIQTHDNTTDIIVISDTSAPSLPVIILSDGDESEIEVIPCEKRKAEKTPRINSNEQFKKKREKKAHNTTVVNKKKSVTSHKPHIPSIALQRSSLGKAKLNSKKRKSNGRNRSDEKPVKKRSKEINSCKVGENIYVENPVVLPKTGLRPIIIDGSNVAFHHSNNSYFSCRGLEICIKYFKNRGHEVIAFVPQYRVKYRQSDNPKLLDLLVKSGDVVLTPSRMVNGNRIVPYDDRFIVQTAVIKGGIIVTRDNYRDLLVENPSWAETIHYRLLQFTWVQDLLMFPNDPLGKRGPSLEEFLRFGSGK